MSATVQNAEIVHSTTLCRPKPTTTLRPSTLQVVSESWLAS